MYQYKRICWRFYID